MIVKLQRDDRIVEYLESMGVATVDELSRQLEVSPATVRRDLARLSKANLVRKVHGGAGARTRTPGGSRILDRSEVHEREKAAIGMTAAALVNSGETVFLSSGTTVLAVARSLLQRRDLSNVKILTNSLLVLELFASRDDFEIIVLGGHLHRKELSFTGSLAEQAVSMVHADKAFTGAIAFNQIDGLMSDDEWEMQTMRSILKISEKVILVADHWKFQRMSSYKIADPSSFSAIVTDDGVDKSTEAVLRAMEIEVYVSDTQTHQARSGGARDD